jgi:hypothetical protein
MSITCVSGFASGFASASGSGCSDGGGVACSGSTRLTIAGGDFVSSSVVRLSSTDLKQQQKHKKKAKHKTGDWVEQMVSIAVLWSLTALTCT